MAQGTLWFQPIQHIFSASVVVPGARAYFYLAGSVTPVNVFSDVGLTTAITQPVVADANGVFVEIFLTPGTAYKVDVQTSAGVSLTGYPADNQLAIPASSAVVAFTGTAGEALTAGQAVYLSDGSGSKNAGQWYKADPANTYSSTLPEVGMVPASIASGSSGLIQQGGQVTGLTSLTIGQDYFISTAGAITTTAPSNARFLGRADSTTTLILGANQAVKGQTLISPTISTSLITPSAGLYYGVCGGRLTLTAGLPVTVTDVTGATAVLFSPYGVGLGNIGLYDGSANWTILPFVETSLALGTLTSGLPYDIFAYNNSGVMALELLAWTSASARATALVLQNGVLSKTGALTRRYLGTFFTDSTTTTSDAGAGSATSGRHLYNYYNRVPRFVSRVESTATWNYTTATVRQANGSTANQIQVMQGVAEGAIDLTLDASMSNTNAGVTVSVGIGEDSTTTYAAGTVVSAAVANDALAFSRRLSKIPAVGHHIYSWNEWSTATGTTTWTGVLTQGSTVTSGLSGVVWM